MERHPQLRYTGQSEGATRVRNPQGASFELNAAEQALAQLFDGSNDAVRRTALAAALNPPVDAATLIAFAAELGQAGLLEPGRLEPLPVPVHTGAAAAATPQGFPPSHAAGSLAAPGYPGGLAGALERWADDNKLWRNFTAPRWMLALGRALNFTLDPPGMRYALWLLAALTPLALWFHRLEAANDAVQLMAPLHLFLTALACTALMNLCGQSARAAAIQQWTGQTPRMGIFLSMRIVPRLSTDTEGPAERAERDGRLRIIAAPLNAALVVFVLAVLGWFIGQRSGAYLTSFCLGLAVISMAMFLFRANPLAQREGYHLLAQSLGVPDLREQAWLALFKQTRAWPTSAPPRRRVLQLYGAAVVLYVVGVITLLVTYPGRWLETAWGGTGVVAFLAFLGLTLSEQIRRYQSDRRDIVGGFSLKLKTPDRRGRLLILAALLLCLFPYRYSPSGEFVVLPKDRADVRALVSGDVREVLVKEGDTVEANAVIARLANHQQKAQVAASNARLQELQADLTLAKAGARDEEIEIAKQRVATARKRFDVADAEAKRLQSAYERRAVSVQDYQRAQGASDVQQQELAEAQRQLDLTTGGTRPERIKAQEAAVQAEEAQLKFYDEQLRNTEIRAPIGGRLVSESLLFARGKYLQAGELLGVVEDTSSLRAELRVPEAQARDIKPGADASVRVWAMPGTAFDGVVESVAPNAEDGPYGKVVRVRVILDADATGRVSPGMTGQGKADGGTYPLIVVFTKAIARFVMIEVWSWLP